MYGRLRFTYITDDIAFSKTVPVKLAPLPDGGDEEDSLDIVRTLTCVTPSFTIDQQPAIASDEQIGDDGDKCAGGVASAQEGAGDGKCVGGGDVSTTSGGEVKVLESGSKISLELAMNGKQFVSIPKFQFTLK